MNRLQSIQALRGLAVLSVMFFHLMLVERKYGGAGGLLPAVFDYGMSGVDLFFVISGFVMVVVTRGKFQDASQAMRFLYHRVARIYPTYWVYTLLVLGVFLVNPALVNSSEGNRTDILASFLLLPSDIHPLVIVGWTLRHEVYFYLVFFLVLLVVPERRLLAAMLCWGGIVAGANLAFDLHGPSAELILHPLTLEFVLGSLAAIIFFHRRQGRGRHARALPVIAAMGLLVSFGGFVLYQNLAGDIDPWGWWRIPILGIPATVTVYCLVNAEQAGFAMHALLVKIGNASYSIYLSHILTLTAVGRVWGTFASDALWDNYIMLPLLVISAIAVGMLGYQFIEKPLLDYGRRIA